MPLTFLYPWLWLGALAVAAPIWLHLRRKRETNLLRFSAVRFLADQAVPRRSPLQLQHLLLFCIRVLALLLLVGAFAWPYLRGGNTAPIKESRVYLLDNTLSRQANDGFAHDRARLIDALRQAEGDIQFAVVELNAAPRVLVAFGDDRQAALQKLQSLRPSFQRGSYLAAFRQANSLLANSLGARRRIILLGDNQENQWNENIDTPPFLRDVQVDLPSAPAARLPNLSLSDPRVQRIFLGDKSLVNFTVKLSHWGEAKAANLQVRASGKPVLTRTVALENQPETILIQAQWETDAASWLRGDALVEGAPDALPADNRVSFALAPVVEGRLELLAQSPYLRTAVSPEVMRGQWATRVLDPAHLGAELTETPNEEVLCLESHFLQSADARKLVLRYLTNGRGVFLIVDRLTPAIAGFLRELGLESEGTVQTTDAEPQKFQFVFSNHPIFHPFASPEYGNLMEIRVSQYARLRATAAMPLVFSENGAGLFFQGTKFPGKLFVIGFGLDRAQSSWPIHQTFIPFLDLTLQAARAADSSPTSFEPGELAQLQTPAGSGPRELVLREEGRELERAAVTQGKAQIRMPEVPGLYSLTYDDQEKIQKIFSINPSPKESQLAFVESPRTVDSWRLAGSDPQLQAGFSPGGTQLRLAGVLQQRMWWWMLLGGLLALLLEMTLAQARKERT